MALRANRCSNAVCSFYRVESNALKFQDISFVAEIIKVQKQFGRMRYYPYLCSMIQWMEFRSTDKHIKYLEDDCAFIVKYDKESNIVRFENFCPSSFNKNEVIDMLESIRKLLED